MLIGLLGGFAAGLTIGIIRYVRRPVATPTQRCGACGLSITSPVDYLRCPSCGAALGKAAA